MKALSSFPSSLSLENEKVLVRLDLNVPMDTEGNILDSSRIEVTIPTIKYLVKKNCKVIITSHLGRPKGKDLFYSLEKIIPLLENFLHEKQVHFIVDCIGPETTEQIDSMASGEIVLLENVRFYAEEESNDDAFAKSLYHGAKFFINDAFGTIHREHASTVGVTKYIDNCYAGFLLEKELFYFHSILDSPLRPFAAIIGGSKVSTKLEMIKTLLDKVNILMVGGGMVFTFFHAFGLNVGSSLVEKEQKENVIEIQQLAKKKNVELLFPTDIVVTDNIVNPTRTKVVPNHAIPDGWIGVDHGPITNMIVREKLQNCQTIFWNGPMGIYEKTLFETGTKFVAFFLSEMGKNNNTTTIVGGGDSMAVLKKYNLQNKITHISSGGGAFMRLFEHSPLPALESLK